ncbi:MAG: aminoacyl-tRNA hydrolase [Patescibacteria group bacterium]|jgi:PTH1 family peptidyl-tRNA hydrolase
MKLIIGLGNPGKAYANNWHNLGFMALDKLQEDNNFEKFKKEAKLLAEISVGKIGREKVILAKPQTFMNKSGEAVSLISHYFKLSSENLIVIHDDIDLPLGKIRIAYDSSAGGHNGVKSIIGSLGTQKFSRIKIGVKTDKLDKIETADYVLEKIPASNKKIISNMAGLASSACLEIITDSVTSAMNIFN